MRKVFILTMLVLPILLSAQTNTTINANIKGLKPGIWVYCETFDDSFKDSVKTVAAGFHFKLNIAKGDGNIFLLQIDTGYIENNRMFVYLDKGTVTINGIATDFKNAKASGTASIKNYNAYDDFIKNNPQLKGMAELYQKADDLYSNHDSVGLAALQPQLDAMDSINTALAKQWVSEHLNSPISAYIISSVVRYSAGSNMGSLDTMMSKLNAEAKDNIPAKNILHSIEIDKLTGIGKTALDFTQNDTTGKPVSLKDFRGKYVLIDFWASWCHPCREENPNVVKAYNQYKDKNFTIVSISFDEEKENWLNAIQKDGLAWNHVSDLKGWNNAVGKEYDIESIPSNILIDPSGKIIAKDLQGDNLENKLAEVLKTN